MGDYSATATQSASTVGACSDSQSTLGVLSTATAGLVPQLPTSSAYSQPSMPQPVYTQPSLCQSSSMSTAATLFPHTQPLQSSVPAVDAQPWMSPASVHSDATQPGLVHSLDGVMELK